MLISNPPREWLTRADWPVISRRAVLAALSSLIVAGPTAAASGQSLPVRFGVLGFGTAAWEVDVVQRYGLDISHGVSLEVRRLASTEAGKTALLAGSVDVIVSDWVWVTRQRAEGADLVFVPYSRVVGALELPAGSPVRRLADFDGKRLGVAGGPLDKSWILLRALNLRQSGRDLAASVQPVFGAPPLLEQEFLAGRLDGLLTFWNFAAQLEAAGAQRLLNVGQILEGLGVSGELPMLGYVFHEDWARADPAVLSGFLKTVMAAKSLLATSDSEWHALAPQLGTDDVRLQAALRDAYRDGIPRRFGRKERDDAARLFSILADLSGEALVGKAKGFDPGIFWSIPA
ncbi:ABC transporter substrate-binding protein [Mesorhizobium sp. B2-5-13]|nr:ABC transporter substrate-binding protein [Mesorhizobium sp. B2-5-13]TPK52270.1 ABC transporter substrate-binding protein [Mesorhizobium sp. B2-5-5]